MKSFVKFVRENVSDKCCTTRCRKPGCKVRLSQEPCSFVLIDLDHPESPRPNHGKCCDFLLFSKDDDGKEWVVPMELKRGKATTSEIVPQLQAGAGIAKKLVSNSADVEFRPVAAYGGGLTKYERRAFRKNNNKVRFRQKREFVRLIKCGTCLTQVLLAS